MRPYVKNSYYIDGNITYLDINFKNQIVRTIFDTEMYSKVSQYHWRISVKRQKLYVVTGQYRDNSQLYLHHICCKTPVFIKGYEIDHRNGNSLDNRSENLKLVSRQENIDNTNAKSDNKLQIRGVSFDNRYQNYVVDFTYHGKRFYCKPWKELEKAIYCRYCFESYFNISILINNPIAQPYLSILSDETKNYINTYVSNIISGN